MSNEREKSETEPERSSFDVFRARDVSDEEVRESEKVYGHLSTNELRANIVRLLAAAIEGEEIRNLRLLSVVFHAFFIQRQKCSNELDEVGDEIESLTAEVETKRKTIADEIVVKRKAIDRISEELEKIANKLRWLQIFNLKRQRTQFEKDIEKILDDHGAKLQQTEGGSVIVFFRDTFADKETSIHLKKARLILLEKWQEELDNKLNILHEFFCCLEANGISVQDRQV